MIYYKPAFDLFVKALMLKLRDNEFLDMPQIKERRPTRKIWIMYGKDEILPRSLKIAGTYTSNPMIFDDLLHRGLKYHSNSDQIIIAGLNYLGIQLPEEFLIQNLSVKQEAGVLFQKFLEDHGDLGKKQFLENPALKVCDLRSNVLLDAPNVDQAKEIKIDTNKKVSFTPSVSSIGILSTDQAIFDVEDTVENFYHHISNKDFVQAWKIISEYNDIRSDYLDIHSQYGCEEHAILILGFIWTVALNGVHIWDTQINEKDETATCKVYFQEDIDLMSAYRDSKLKIKFEDFDELLYCLTSEVQFMGFFITEKWPTLKVELEGFLYKLWIQLAVKYTANGKEDKLVTATFPRFYSITLERNPKTSKWFIRHILPIKKHAM